MDFDKLEKMLGTSSNIAQKNEIEIGDTVCVNFHVARYTLCNKAEVLYVPQSSGDAWHFRDIETKELHEVSEGCTITLIKSI